MAMEDLRRRVGMQLVKWTPYRKNALRGFADVRLPNGLVIYSCPVLFSHGKAWATFPGKPQYVKVIAWGNRSTADRFSERVVELVRERDPSAFVDDVPASAAGNQ